MELTEEIISSISDAISIGADLQMAAQYAGVPFDALMGWMQIAFEEHELSKPGGALRPDKEIYRKLLVAVQQTTAETGIAWMNTISKAAENDPGWAKYMLEHRLPEMILPVISSPFPASEATPGQAESRSAYQNFLEVIQRMPWREEYDQMRAEGWDWRKAVYIAWSAMPSSKRIPKTKGELANFLGLESDRTIRKWEEKNPEIEKRIERFKVDLLGAHTADVLQAWVTVAKMPDGSAHRDRITFLETMGIYKPKAGVEISGPEGGPIEVRDLDAEYEKDMARLAEMIAGPKEQEAEEANEAENLVDDGGGV